MNDDQPHHLLCSIGAKKDSIYAKFTHLKASSAFTIITVSGVDAKLATASVSKEALVHVFLAEFFVLVRVVATVILVIAQFRN